MIDKKIRDRRVQEYLGETNEVLNDVDLASGNVSSDISNASSEFSRLLGAFSVLRVQGRGLETTLLDITLQRLCEYLNDLHATESEINADPKFYSSNLHDIVDNDRTEANIRTFSASLPMRTPIGMGNIVPVDLEIMLVEPNKTVAKLVSRELRACGYRVTTLRGSIDALTYAIRTKPDMIIASAELDKISGINLACAISAIPLTQKIPYALLTSRDSDHAALYELPEASTIITKGGKFGDGQANALAQFDIR
jgi:CheY-like chemotaxis protein